MAAMLILMEAKISGIQKSIPEILAAIATWLFETNYSIPHTHYTWVSDSPVLYSVILHMGE